jgi:hypothetical protein
MSDLTAASVRGADELPEAVVAIVTYAQDGLTKLEDFDGLDAASAQKPVPHPPRASITLHDVVRDPPHERQLDVSASYRSVRRLMLGKDGTVRPREHPAPDPP